MIPTFDGQPSRKAVEVHLAPSHLIPPVAHEDGVRGAAARLDRVHAPVGERQQPGRADDAERGRVHAAGVEFAFVALAGEVLLVRADDDARRFARAVELRHGRRVDDLALVFVFVLVRRHVAVERRLVARRVDRGELVRVLDEHGEAFDRFATGMPCVHVAVLARRDDVEPFAFFSFEVGEHRRGHEAALGALAHAGALRLPRRVAGQRRARVGRVRGLVEDPFALRVPGVDVALHVVGDDRQLAVAREVSDRRRLDHRVVVRRSQPTAAERVLAAVQRQRFGVHRPAGEVFQRAARRAVLVGVDPAVGVGHDQLVGVAAGEVGEHRAGVAVAFHLQREALEHVRVAVQEQLAAVLAGHRRAGRAGGRRHDDAHREGVGQRVGTAVGALRAAAVLVARERRRRALREQRRERRRADVRQQPRERFAVHRAAVAVGRRHAREVSARGARRVVRLCPRGDFHAAGVFAARADVAVERERFLPWVHLLEPFGRGDVGMGRDPALRGRFHRLERVQAAVAEELVPALARRVAGGVGQRADHAAVLVGGEGRVEVRVGARRRHAHAARRFRRRRRVDVVGLPAFAAIGGRPAGARRVRAERRGAVDRRAFDVARGHQLAHLVGRDRARRAVDARAARRRFQLR